MVSQKGNGSDEGIKDKEVEEVSPTISAILEQMNLLNDPEVDDMVRYFEHFSDDEGNMEIVADLEFTADVILGVVDQNVTPGQWLPEGSQNQPENTAENEGVAADDLCLKNENDSNNGDDDDLNFPANLGERIILEVVNDILNVIYLDVRRRLNNTDKDINESEDEYDSPEGLEDAALDTLLLYLTDIEESLEQSYEEDKRPPGE